MDKRIRDKTGEERVMNNGEIAKIIKYKKWDDIDVLFIETGYISYGQQYSNFKCGKLKDPYLKIIKGVACVGETSTIDENGKVLKSREVWGDMIKRCYDEKQLKKRPSYIGVTVCDEWLCYANFKEWYDKNIYEIKDERIHLDKDILIKGNKVYSPETCIFVPQRINNLFREFNNNEFPTLEERSNGTFAIRVRMNGKSKRISGFETKEKAEECYFKEKRQIIKEIAEEYKDKIPNKLYNRLIEISNEEGENGI